MLYSHNSHYIEDLVKSCGQDWNKNLLALLHTDNANECLCSPSSNILASFISNWVKLHQGSGVNAYWTLKPCWSLQYIYEQTDMWTWMCRTINSCIADWFPVIISSVAMWCRDITTYCAPELIFICVSLTNIQEPLLYKWGYVTHCG